MITSATPSLAARATMSAHETTPGHAASTAALAVSITSNPSRLRLGIASFSARWPLVELSSTEPSQP
ncbi:unnamed protein product [Spirodela intermedia]|uniref:Uncharacterized protein n=1 Tax=Spirodela intermedia TaxID=51605 RepID=A0A7I8LFK3_SPIIN|nr:unnamed protein product [Spirodela intermedia]